MVHTLMQLAQEYKVSQIAGTIAGICLLVAIIAWLAKKFRGGSK